jgi:hypothetical protein
MKKIFFLLMFTVISITNISATEVVEDKTNVTVECGAAWSYGYTTVAYSNVASTLCDKSSTVVSNTGKSNSSGRIAAGTTQAKSSIISVGFGASFYYNIY